MVLHQATSLCDRSIPQRNRKKVGRWLNPGSGEQDYGCDRHNPLSIHRDGDRNQSRKPKQPLLLPICWLFCQEDKQQTTNNK